MAVVDKYTDANIEAGKKAAAVNAEGTKTFTVVGTVAVASGDDNNSVYRVLANIPSNAIPVKIEVHNTAVTGGTDYDLGLYKTQSGAVVDADILADGISMATARTIATSNNAGMTTIGIANGTQTLATLSAQTAPDASYDVALTANTVGTADGTIRVTATFAYAT